MVQDSTVKTQLKLCFDSTTYNILLGFGSLTTLEK